MDYNDFVLNPELAEASTLPSDFYLHARFLDDEIKRVFHRTWQPVGRVDQVARKGDFFATEVQGEPVLVVRGNDDVLRAFSNVCRHRGSVIARGEGNAKVLQCPYHAWTYGLDGKLAGQPEFEGVRNWNKSGISLPAFQVEEWGPFVFVHLGDGKPALKEVLGKIPEEIASISKLEDYRFIAKKDYVVDCNWKVYVDNYLEGYHLPLVHPALFRELDYQKYRVDTFEYYSFQYAPLRPVKAENAAERRYTEGATPLYYWLFPNFMLNVYPDSMHTSLILPMGHDKTLVVFEWFLPAGTLKTTTIDEAYLANLVALNDVTQKEDMVICALVQKGLGSRGYKQGRYSVKRENGVHHFHGLLQKFMRGD